MRVVIQKINLSEALWDEETALAERMFCQCRNCPMVLFKVFSLQAAPYFPTSYADWQCQAGGEFSTDYFEEFSFGVDTVTSHFRTINIRHSHMRRVFQQFKLQPVNTSLPLQRFLMPKPQGVTPFLFSFILHSDFSFFQWTLCQNTVQLYR